MVAAQRIDDRTGRLRRMRVTAAWRRKGVATDLLNTVEEFCREQGYKRLILDTTEQQTAAHRLYEEDGFCARRRADARTLPGIRLRERALVVVQASPSRHPRPRPDDGLGGPYGTRLLADMGAEVIKIESVNNWDVLRASTASVPMSNAFGTVALLQRTQPQQVRLRARPDDPKGPGPLPALAAIADVVIDNFRAEAMDNLGLSTRCCARQSERIVVV